MVERSPIGQALAAAIMHSTEPMVLSDARLPDYPMVVVNDAFAALTGYPRSESVGRNCRFLQGAGTDQETARRIGRTIVAGRGCIEWISWMHACFSAMRLPARLPLSTVDT